jgi:hypothetical protein
VGCRCPDYMFVQLCAAMLWALLCAMAMHCGRCGRGGYMYIYIYIYIYRYRYMDI